jgi:quercetin dioxygenase-like cupin family protein
VTDSNTRAYWLFANLVIVHVTGAETDGRLTVVEFLTPPDDMTPLHIHERDSQTSYVLEGEVTFYLPDGAHALGPGQCIHQPAGVPQTERVTSTEPARVLDINAPAGFEEFVATVGRPAERLELPPQEDEMPDFDQIVAVAAAHGVRLLGPPGELPEPSTKR